jgi:hypothetical protein
LILILIKNSHATLALAGSAREAQSAQRKIKKLGGLCGFAREKAQNLVSYQ